MLADEIFTRTSQRANKLKPKYTQKNLFVKSFYKMIFEAAFSSGFVLLPVIDNFYSVIKGYLSAF